MVTGENKSLNSAININKVFVYGTLMKGFSNYKIYLEGKIERITPATINGLLYHLPEGYPALLEGNEIIKGEVVEPVDEELLKALDWLEDYVEGGSDNLYDRVIKKVMTEDGKEKLCWVYIFKDSRYAKEKGTHVAHGDWRRFMEGK